MRARDGFVVVETELRLASWHFEKGEELHSVAYLVGTTNDDPTTFLAEVWFHGSALQCRQALGAYRVSLPGNKWERPLTEDLRRLLRERLVR